MAVLALAQATVCATAAGKAHVAAKANRDRSFDNLYHLPQEVLFQIRRDMR